METVKLEDVKTIDILNELLRREPFDSSFELKSSTVTSYVFKFYKAD